MKLGSCHCGHDVDTHYERAASCLAAMCECRSFRDAQKSDPAPPKKRLVYPDNHPHWCRCFGCNHGYPT